MDNCFCNDLTCTRIKGADNRQRSWRLKRELGLTPVRRLLDSSFTLAVIKYAFMLEISVSSYYVPLLAARSHSSGGGASERLINLRRVVRLLCFCALASSTHHHSFSFLFVCDWFTFMICRGFCPRCFSYDSRFKAFVIVDKDFYNCVSFVIKTAGVLSHSYT